MLFRDVNREGRECDVHLRCAEARPRLERLDAYAAWGDADPDVVADARRMRAMCARAKP